MIRAVILLVFLWVCCLAQKPLPCSSSALMSGGLSVSTQSEKLAAFAKYTYDAIGRRIRLKNVQSYANQTYQLDVLLLYKQGILYKINNRERTCSKKPLTTDFIPLAIPKDASLVGQMVLGSATVPGEGILVNTWTGELLMKRGVAKYVSTVTEFSCVPVSTLFSTDRKGWVVASFFNNIVGMADPQDFIPPEFCDAAKMEEKSTESSATFFNLF